MNHGAAASYINRFTREEPGNAATEYAVCLALIVLASIAAVVALGVAISDLLPDFADYIS